MDFRRLVKHWILQLFSPDEMLRHKYKNFTELLQHDKECLELLTELEEIENQNLLVDWSRIELLTGRLCRATEALIGSLLEMNPARYRKLDEQFKTLSASLRKTISLPDEDPSPPYTVSFLEAAREPGLVGGKAHSLARVYTDTSLSVPRGFCITIKAFNLFLEHNRLRPQLDKILAEIDLDDWERLEALAGELTDLIRGGEIPPALAAEIRGRLADHERQGVNGPWILRSSALSEDSESSFAGQYASVLHVTGERILEAYKKVLASKYSSRAITYRLRCGFADQETPMGVILLEMIEAVVSGVIYTKAVEWDRREQEPLALYAICGLGEHLVDGTLEPEVYYLSRGAEPSLLNSGSNSCLSSESARLLGDMGLQLENLFGGPQDIEWCQDEHGTCFILQSRPLILESGISDKKAEESEAVLNDYPVLIDRGVTASSGIGAGRVFILTNETELREIPEGAVLVAATLPPSFMGIIGRLRAVVAEGGSQASHFASIAREFGLPVIAGCKEARKMLPAGQNVIVDADYCRVYLGGSAFLIKGTVRPGIAPDSPYLSRLQNLMTFISPLHLTDPTSPDFVPEKCQSFHDMIRFAHEKGMAEMFSLVGRSGRGLSRARQLTTDLPFTLYVLGLDKSILPEADHKKAVAPGMINSNLMQSFWQGLTHEEVVWPKGLVFMDWETLDRVSAGIMSLKSANLGSYAVIGKDYLHLLLRFGYHFAVLDAFCSENPEANYIAFRFKGGGGDYDNRLRRVNLIQRILEWAGFRVKTQGDLLEARLERHGADTILARLTLLGILQGKTQLLDLKLNSEADLETMIHSFMEKFGTYLVE